MDYDQAVGQQGRNAKNTIIIEDWVIGEEMQNLGEHG